jgi:opacity protein-like surface antigen
MKKILLLLAAFCFIVSGLVYASPVGNPARPLLANEEMPFSIGADLDFVFNRELDASGEDLEIDQLNMYAARLSYTLEKRAEFYCLLGAANGVWKESYAGANLKYETETAFAWGIGATVYLYEFENGIQLGLDGSYRSSEPDVDSITLNGIRYSIPSGGVSDVNIEYGEWQVALGISKQIDKFVPYGGIKYSDVKTSLEATISGTTYSSDDVSSDMIFGIFLGCDYVVHDNISLGIEGRFIDETALNVRGIYRF